MNMKKIQGDCASSFLLPMLFTEGWQRGGKKSDLLPADNTEQSNTKLGGGENHAKEENGPFILGVQALKQSR